MSEPMTSKASSTLTRLDTGTDSRSHPTRLDNSNSSSSTATRLDTPVRQQAVSSLIQLPSAVRERYRIRQQMPTAGAEADLFLLEPLEGDSNTADDQLRVLKLYRFNVK